jgi:hypothetical protein
MEQSSLRKKKRNKSFIGFCWAILLKAAKAKIKILIFDFLDEDARLKIQLERFLNSMSTKRPLSIKRIFG